MRSKTLLVGLLAATLTLTAAPRLGAQDDEETPLQEAMHQVMGGQRAMRRLVNDPEGNKDALLTACAGVQRGALAAFSLVPDAPDGQDPDLWRIGFQRQILQLLDAGLECEQATRTGDAAAVSAAYGRMGEAKNAGHDRFKIDD